MSEASDEPASGGFRRSLLYACFALLLLGGLTVWMIRSSQRAKDRSGAMAWLFKPGRPARLFFVRARSMGADRFTVEEEGKEPVYLERRRADFKTKWEAFDANFQSLRSGAADVQFTGVPPFERRFCRIEFKNGLIVATRTQSID